MPKRTNSNNDDKNKEPKQRLKKQKKEESMAQQEDKKKTNSIQISSQTNTTTVATDDYKKKPLLEWNVKDVQDFLKDNGFGAVAAKFSKLNGAQLANLKEEHLVKLLEDEASGMALSNTITAVLKQDQEKANANTIQVPSTTTIEPTVKHDQLLTFEICKKWGVKCPDIVELGSYKPQSQFVKEGLPCFNNQLDLRFLTGDLDNKDKDTDVVKEILERKASLSVGVLLGVSGCGKTKAILDIARKMYLIWFDAVHPKSQSLKRAVELSCSTKNPNIHLRTTENVNAIQASVVEEFLSRLCLLALTRDTYPTLSAEQWRNIQLEASDTYYDSLTTIKLNLREGGFLSTENLNRMLSFLFSVLNQMPWLAIDEASKLVNETAQQGYFYSAGKDKYDEFPALPFLRPILLILGMSFKHILIAGTSVSLSTVSSLTSSVLKHNGEFPLITRFRVHTKDDTLQLLKRLLNDHPKLLAVSHILQGRSRIATSFVLEVEKQRPSDLLEFAKTYLNDKILRREDTSAIASGVLRAWHVPKDQTKEDLQQHLVCRYISDFLTKLEQNTSANLLMAKEIWGEGKIDLTNLGICFPVVVFNNIEFQVVEFVVVACLMKHVGREFLNAFVSRVFLTKTGEEFQHVVMLSLWSLQTRKLSEIACIAPACTKFLQLSNIILNVTAIVHLKTIEDLITLEEGSLCYLDSNLGPDHVWLISKFPLVVCFVQDKQTPKDKLRSDVLTDGVEVTVPEFWNSSITSDDKKERKLDMNAISQMVRWLGTNTAYVFRIHICRGTPPAKSNQHTFKSRKTKYNQRTIVGYERKQDNNGRMVVEKIQTNYHEFRIDIDSSCINNSGLFQTTKNLGEIKQEAWDATLDESKFETIEPKLAATRVGLVEMNVSEWLKDPKNIKTLPLQQIETEPENPSKKQKVERND